MAVLFSYDDFILLHLAFRFSRKKGGAIAPLAPPGYATVCLHVLYTHDLKLNEFHLTGEMSTNLTPSVSSTMSRYAQFLKTVYDNTQIMLPDKLLVISSKMYIKLALVTDKEKIEMADILKEKSTRLVLVDGAPGIGKSTFSWELCRQWHVMESLKQFSLVVLLRLREESVRTASSISDLLYHSDKELCMHVREEVERREGEGVLFVFDGFDEFPAELRKKSLVMNIINGSEYLPKATVVVTSRPSVSSELRRILRATSSKHIEIVGFTENEIIEFASSVFGDSGMISSFKTYQATNQVIKNLMYNPLNCAIIVTIYYENFKSDRPVPHTQTQLYTELTLCLLSRYLTSTDDSMARRLPDRLEDIPHDSNLYQQLMKIGELAFEGLKERKVIFDHLPKDCCDLGLLVEHKELLMRKEATTYNFFHLTLQEYMSAFYVSQLPASQQKEVFPNQSIVVKKFIAGLTKMKGIGWDHLLPKRSQGDDMVVKDLLIECLFESHDVEIINSVFGQSTICYELRYYLTPNFNASYALGYCIGVSNNSFRLHFAGAYTEMLGHGIQSVRYRGGKITELDLSNCFGIHEDEKLLLHIPKPVLQHLTSLKFEKCEMDKRAFDNLAKCIPVLPSLTSLDINSNPGGERSLVELMKALEIHGKLERLEMHYISYGVDSVKSLSDMIRSSSTLRELRVGEIIHHLRRKPRFILEVPPSEEVFELLVTIILFALSSLEKIIIHCRDDTVINASSVTEDISANITSLEITYDSMYSYHMDSTNCPKWVNIISENKTLQELILKIPLKEDQLHDILRALSVNNSLKKILLCYYELSPELVQLAALDPRVILETKYHHF